MVPRASSMAFAVVNISADAHQLTPHFFGGPTLSTLPHKHVFDTRRVTDAAKHYSEKYVEKGKEKKNRC